MLGYLSSLHEGAGTINDEWAAKIVEAAKQSQAFRAGVDAMLQMIQNTSRVM